MSHIYYYPNPDGNRVGDCTVRALCKATGHDWDYVHAMLCAIRYADIIEDVRILCDKTTEPTTRLCLFLFEAGNS